MNVLVTGATSSLGAAIVTDLLASQDVERVLAVDASHDVRGTEPRLAYHDVDLSHARAVHDLLWGPARELAIDAVIHTAAQSQHADRIARALVLGCAGHPTIRKLVARSSGEVYAPPRGTTSLIDEDAPLDFTSGAARGVVEVDTVFATRRDDSLSITVLRCAEIFAPGCDGPLRDYLSSRVCLRPIGFDPMMNLLSLPDAVVAFGAALRAEAAGVFNISGADTLPLSSAIAACGRREVALPAVLLAPLYAARRTITRFEFRYEQHARRFHVGGILDGTRAARLLGFVPRHRIAW